MPNKVKKRALGDGPGSLPGARVVRREGKGTIMVVRRPIGSKTGRKSNRPVTVTPRSLDNGRRDQRIPKRAARKKAAIRSG